MGHPANSLHTERESKSPHSRSTVPHQNAATPRRLTPKLPANLLEELSHIIRSAETEVVEKQFRQMAAEIKRRDVPGRWTPSRPCSCSQTSRARDGTSRLPEVRSGLPPLPLSAGKGRTCQRSKTACGLRCSPRGPRNSQIQPSVPSFGEWNTLAFTAGCGSQCSASSTMVPASRPN